MTLRLPRLDARLFIVDQQGRPTLQYQQLIGKIETLIEEALDANDELDATQEAALDALDDTTAKANACYEVLGPGAYAITTTQTLPEDCRTALVDCTAGAVTVTLLPVADCLADVVVKKVDASGNAVTIEGDGAETIDGAANASLASQWDYATLRPALGAWYRIGG